MTAAEAKTFADQSVAALAEIVKFGWAIPSELNEPDFNALRGRADFRKLYAEVEEKSAAAKDNSGGPGGAGGQSFEIGRVDRTGTPRRR